MKFVKLIAIAALFAAAVGVAGPQFTGEEVASVRGGPSCGSCWPT